MVLEVLIQRATAKAYRCFFNSSEGVCAEYWVPRSVCEPSERSLWEGFAGELHVTDSWYQNKLLPGLKRRSTEEQARKADQARKAAEAQMEERLIAKGVYRQIAQRFHPDRGGSDDAMAAINAFWEALKNADALK